MVFVADALGQWLVEQLADAGRKKLTELILGSEQERALRQGIFLTAGSDGYPLKMIAAVQRGDLGAEVNFDVRLGVQRCTR